jgi:TPR repeat protein
MRISEALLSFAVAGGAATGLSPPVLAFDGTQSPSGQVAVVPPVALAPPGSGAPATAMSAIEAFRSGALALKHGEKAKALTSLQYAAENGHPLAQWKLGQMYAKGDGVPRDDLRAFEYYSRVADSYADDRPDTPRGRIVSMAFVALGHYYLEGIPNSQVRANPERAREMFHYAATYFADPEAQYDLARLYLNGTGGTPKDARQAVRWLALAAHKGHYQAQALLGAMLFKGDQVKRQASRGLMWLTLARDSANGTEDRWIADLYDSAFKQATDDERAMAQIYLERWMTHRRY